jgi:hypothetical protein
LYAFLFPFMHAKYPDYLMFDVTTLTILGKMYKL